MRPTVAETHVSTVFFARDRAYKLLKPIRTSYLDYGSVEARLAAVDDEIELNRRMAPDVYLGRADVVEEGELVDRMIVMRRLPDDRRITALVDDPDFDVHVRAVTRVIASFHSRQEPLVDAVDIAGRDAVRRNWDDNATDMEPLVGDVFDPQTFARVRYLAGRFLDFGGPMFSRRLAEGWVRDGHGDLTAQDIFCLDDGPRILDCLAFDQKLRIGDVLIDVAFFVMDLDRIAGPEMAAAVWHHYQDFTNEHHPIALAEHYVAYRANVRAKVESLRHRQGDPDAADAARAYLRLCLAHLERARKRLIVVGGTPGTGKTTLAKALSDAFGWVWIGSDGLRKDLTGHEHQERIFVAPNESIYAPDVTEQTYATLFERARTLLDAGESVIIDASFAAAAHRERARSLGVMTGADVLELECALPAGLAEERIAARLAAGVDPSDARPEILQALRDRHAPWPEAITVDTSGSREDAAATGVATVRAR